VEFVLREEFGPYTTVLVAIINNLRDFAIVRDEHWYRIPVRRAPTRAINASVLAFYQTRVFGEEAWAINYWAEAQQWEIVKRVDLLPQEASHSRAQEKYYQIQLGKLGCLPHPIVSKKWRRITFITTTWERLMRAQEVTELLHGDIWEERLYRALRKMGVVAEGRVNWEAGGGEVWD
jgi:hypothetical protein